MTAGVRTLMCGFCRREFTEDRGQPACERCPLADGCRYVRCPYCGYENPLAPAWLEQLGAWVQRAVSGAPRTGEPKHGTGRAWGVDCPTHHPVPVPDACAASDCDAVPLTALAEDEGARVTCLDDEDENALKKLAAMGVLPGAEIVLLQRSPVFVFRLGYAEFAVDEQLARRVRVRREA